MTAINWHNIRPVQNSLNDGFEELVCQLASKEVINGQKYFQRIGKPDGGKECYWQLQDGSLYMWQAKYFTASLTNTQWAQIDASIKTAINNHPDLKQYYVCLPIDMPDGKVRGQKSLLDKWKEKVQQWQDYACVNGNSVEFRYWGSNELISRLSLRENEGLAYFWFNKEELSDEWLSKKNNESINSLGARYTKELNFELKIAEIFDGLSRDNDFESRMKFHYNNLLRNYKDILIYIEGEKIASVLNLLGVAFNEVKRIYEPFCFTSNDPIPINQLKKYLNECADIATDIEGLLYGFRKAVEKEKNVNNRPFSNEISHVRFFNYALQGFIEFLDSPICLLANKPYLLLIGDAGVGKSHLLADIIEKRNGKNQYSLFLLGENFTGSEMPWTQILHNQLRKGQIDEFVFLGALNAKAESVRTRIIVFIDAINEGNGRKVWPKRLKSFVESFGSYPWLGLVISLRSTFVKLIAPEEEIGAGLIVRKVHEGFSEVEYTAAKHFFNYYKIIQPSSPLLNPEFQNPLFLKLFCKSLADQNLHEIPAGYEGITTVIEFFLVSVNKKLSRPDELDFDEKIPLLKYAVEGLVAKLVEDDKDYVDYLEADKIVNSFFKGACNNDEPYLKRLIAEGVFNDDVVLDKNGNPDYIVYFAYQRFQDHLTVSLLLDKYLDENNPSLSFHTGKLYELVKDRMTIYSHYNLIEALAIQLPERINKELFELLPDDDNIDLLADAFIHSLLWRKDKTGSIKSRQFVNDVIIHDVDLFDKFLDVSLLLSMNQGFYFNADQLHSYLMQFSLAQRDEIWTIWLQDKYDENDTNNNAVKRLIDFAWNTESTHTHINDASVLLGCTALGWFLTSSNRYLRDAATKALICYLQNRIHLIPALLGKFKMVNDPYVLERLYAVAYGSVLRTNQLDELVSVCEYIYQEIFNHKVVYPHILLRDYARGVIEYTLHLNYKPNIDVVKVRPPYKSRSLPKRFPSIKEIDRKFNPEEETGKYSRKDWGSTAILMSMTTEYGRGTSKYGDFGRYTFERAFYDWDIDANGLSNYAVQRIFQLGYDPNIFTEFDRMQGSGRLPGHKERIGKKYQWIIFHELLARVSDQHKLKDESVWDNNPKYIAYDGPWYPDIRDIDPTILINKTFAEGFYNSITSNWWFNLIYEPWAQNNRDWLSNELDLPKPESIIEVQDNDGSHWLWLEIHPQWKEMDSVGEDITSGKQKKRLWYQIRSYLIKKGDFNKFKNSFSGNFKKRELPQARELYGVFDREYYWSAAFNFFNKPYYGGKDWNVINDIKTGKKIVEVHRTAEFYNWQKEFDCSKSSSIGYFKPTSLIRNGLNLKSSNREGELTNSCGKVFCFDPSVHNKSVSGLLIRKNELLTFLEKEGLVLVWSVIGEKQIIDSIMAEYNGPYRLNISGIYFMVTDKVSGKLNFELE